MCLLLLPLSPAPPSAPLPSDEAPLNLHVAGTWAERLTFAASAGNPKPKPTPNPSPYRQQQGVDDARAALEQAQLLEAELHGVGGLVVRRAGGSLQQLDQPLCAAQGWVVKEGAP